MGYRALNSDDMVEEVVPLGAHDLVVLRPRDTDALLDEASFEERDEFIPYWADLWPSAILLARTIAARALRGARVLEIGCGLGLPSLAAARAGGRVLATDWSPTAIELLRDNADRNGVALDAEVVSWTEPAALLARAPFQLVLAADVLYERRSVPVLAELLPRLGGEVLLADPGRPPLEAFLERTGTVWARPPVYRLR